MYDNDNLVDIKSLRYVIYARKSTDDPQRQLRSIPDQIVECKAMAERLGIKIVDVLEEKQSAKIPHRRPVFAAMLEDLEKGKYDGILSWHPDRLARNALEGGILIQMVDDGTIQDLKFVTHHFSPDANGKMLLGMAFVLSKQYSDKLSQDVTRGVRKRHLEGKTPIYKHGYFRDESGIYRPDAERFDLIKETWLMRADGKSLKEITDFLNDSDYFRLIKSSGEKQYITQQKLSILFRDPFYFGLLVQAGQTVNLCELYDDFVPMIDRETYDKVQSLSTVRHNPYKSSSRTFYPLKQIVRCAYCQGNMLVGPSSGRKERYLYYRCDKDYCVRNSPENKAKDQKDPTKIKVSVRAKVIFEFVYDLLKEGLNLTEKEYRESYQGLKALGDNEKQRIRTQIETLNGQLRHLKSGITQIALSLPKMLNNETAYQINEEELAKKKQEATRVEASIAKLKTKLTTKEDDDLTLEEFLNISKNAATTVKAGDAVVKDTICRLIFLNIDVDDTKVASCRAKEPFDTLLKTRLLHTSRAEATSVEPAQPLFRTIVSCWKHGNISKEILETEGIVQNSGMNDRGYVYQY